MSEIETIIRQLLKPFFYIIIKIFRIDKFRQLIHFIHELTQISTKKISTKSMKIHEQNEFF
jgi:hypothetical protein